MPDKPLDEDEALVRLTYLDDALIETPSLALERARYEIGHMGEYVNQMLTTSMPTFLAGDRDQIKEISGSTTRSITSTPRSSPTWARSAESR